MPAGLLPHDYQEVVERNQVLFVDVVALLGFSGLAGVREAEPSHSTVLFVSWSAAAMYGNGSYFAVDAAYSARGYATPDARGHKRMYLARVLVGDFTQGRSGMITPPSKGSGNAADLYDSVVDKAANPTMFVVFSDIQAYPEYLITFT